MLIGIFGENCSGKSTLANAIVASLPSEIVTGKDYLRMAKSESEAKTLFQKKLGNAVSGDDLIYVIPEPEQHTHLHDHLFVVVKGEARIQLGDETVVVRKDEAFLVKGAIPHSVWNNQDDETVMFGITVKPESGAKLKE